MNRPPIEVLVVDDVEAIRSNVALLLGLSPDVASVHLASDGADALAEIERTSPDVVLMDIRMPVMDGITAARLIRARFASIAIVFHSAYEDDTMLAQASDIGAEAYFAKGTSVRELAPTLRSAVAAAAQRCDPTRSGDD